MQDRVSAEQQIERLSFRRAPLAAAALCFAGGILLARYTPHAPMHLVVALIALSSIAIVAIENRLAWFPVVALWITLGVAAAEWQPAPALQASLLANADNLSRTVRARVLRVQRPPPRAESHDADSVPPWEAAEDTSPERGQPMLLDLAVEQVEEVTPDHSTMLPVSGGVRVAVYQAGPTFHPACGALLEAPLRLRPLETYRTPGAFDYARYLLNQGIAARSNATAAAIRDVGGGTPGLPCRLHAAQSWASERMVEFAGSPANLRLPAYLRLTGPDAMMLNAMLFGDRAGLTHALRTGFERTGTFHLFVVSGLHIALVATGFYWFLRKLRAPVWAATLLTLAATTGYAALTGFGQPAQRALTMTSVFLLARLLSRDRDAMNALGAAVLGLLVLNPRSLFDASFQMTALVIIAIAGIALPLGQNTPIRNAGLPQDVFERPRRIFAPRAAQLLLMLELWGETLAGLLPPAYRGIRRLPAFLVRALLTSAELVLVSLVAELVMALPMAVYFHRLTVFSVPANLLILPLIGLLIPAALATFTVALVSFHVALLPGAATASLLHAISFAINRLSGMHAADYRIPAPAWWVGLMAIAAWLACCWLARRSRPAALMAAVALPVIAVCLLWPEPPLTHPGVLEITALDVGQGDSILAINPERQTMLIDAGGPVGQHGTAGGAAAFDVGEQVVAPYLWSRRIRRLDVLVLSHAHSDHMGGMPAILADLRPRALWVSVDTPSPLYQALLAEAAGLMIPVVHLHAGEVREWGSVEVEALAPAAGYANGASPRNDDSLVLLMQLDRASVLLEGDAERPSEDAMLASGRLHPVTLLKVGHHGSRTSTNPEFLAAVQPEQAVISVGRNNPFGHPRAEVIERLALQKTHVFRTDLFGLTSFQLTPDGRIHDGSRMQAGANE